jgi:hypothetical protein
MVRRLSVVCKLLRRKSKIKFLTEQMAAPLLIERMMGSGQSAPFWRIEAHMSLTLTNIPRIMLAQGWTNGAKLLSQWFNRAGTRYPNYTTADTTTIKMDWVLSYPGPKALYDEIFDDQIWSTRKGRPVLEERLKSWGKLTNFTETFDQTTKSPIQLEKEYVQYRAYGGGYSGYSGSSGYSSSGYSSSGASGDKANLYSGIIYGGLNDLIAGLGAFTFRVVVAGSVTPVRPAGHEVTITKVGVFVRDSFDFEGFQFLGFWNDSNNTVSGTNPLSGTAVFNSTLRDYRDTHHMGGDFMVFSDLKVTTLKRPHKFLL